MAILQRMPQGSDVQQFSSRIPKETYKAISDWAYENRVSFAVAISVLLKKAVKTEINGSPYIPETKGDIIPREN